MAEILNLNKVRKAQSHQQREAQAAANRAKYGRTKAERQNDRRSEERRAELQQGRRLRDDEKD